MKNRVQYNGENQSLMGQSVSGGKKGVSVLAQVIFL